MTRRLMIYGLFVSSPQNCHLTLWVKLFGTLFPEHYDNNNFYEDSYVLGMVYAAGIKRKKEKCKYKGSKALLSTYFLHNIHRLYALKNILTIIYYSLYYLSQKQCKKKDGALVRKPSQFLILGMTKRLL